MGDHVCPAAGAGIAVAGGRRCRAAAEEKGEGEVGGGFGEHAGRVREPDAGVGGDGRVDVVVADGHVGDDAQARRGGEHGGIDLVDDHREGAIGAGERRGEGGRRRGRGGPVLDRVPAAASSSGASPGIARVMKTLRHAGSLTRAPPDTEARAMLDVLYRNAEGIAVMDVRGTPSARARRVA